MLTITSTALANQEEGDPPKNAPSVAAEDRQNGERTKSRPADRLDAPRKQEIRRERERIEIRERRNESSRRTYDGRADRMLRDPRERRQEDRPDQEGRRQPRRDIGPLDEDRSHEKHEDEREETERRLTQILEASEKLQQAGFDEDARNLRRLADELREHFLGRDGGRWQRETKNMEQQRVRDRSQEKREQLRARSRYQQVNSARGDGRSDPVLDMLRDMRNELAGLRREMNDLRARVDANPGARRGPSRPNLPGQPPRERDRFGDAGKEPSGSRH